MTPWKITIPVRRAEDRDDGLYIVGEASGPEPDGHGSMMSPEAITSFARQISERVENGTPLPYIDHHMKVGVLRHLGDVMEATITPDFHLKVAVKLDEANPASRYLHDSISRGKQYGMSVQGNGVDFEIVRDAGKRLIRFTEVLLNEISNTTSPSWVPSFGTVLTRSIDSTEGEPIMAADSPATPAPTPQVAPSVADNAPAVTVPATPAPDPAPAPATQVETVAEVTRARIAKADSDAVVAAYQAFGATLAGLGIDLASVGTPPVAEAPAPAAAPAAIAPETTTVENSDTGEIVDFNGVQVSRALSEAITGYVSAQIGPLKAVNEQNAAYIAALEALPAGKLPAGVTRAKFEPEGPDLSTLDPQAAMKAMLELAYPN